MRKPASREIILDSVELCVTDVCFLHIQLVGTNVRLPNLKVQTLIVVQCFPHDNIVGIHSCGVCKRFKRAGRLSQALVHLVTARASLFTDHRMSGPPNARQMHAF